MHTLLLFFPIHHFVGPEVAPYDDIKRQIREFLYSQIEEDAAISACLIIHTCNKNREKV